MAAHIELGAWGEEQAVDYLQRKGYTIVERDWKSRHRDIDIIATRDDVVVFVEVKTRSNQVFGEPEDAIDYRKMCNLRAAINHYVQYKHLNKEIRFDIISIVGSLNNGIQTIKHFEDIPMY